MNRRFRRMQEHMPKGKSRRNIEQIKTEERYRQIFHDASGVEMTIFYTCWSLAINRLYKWKSEPILKICHMVDDLYGKLGTGEVTLEELSAELMEKTGVTFDMR